MIVVDSDPKDRFSFNHKTHSVLGIPTPNKFSIYIYKPFAFPAWV